jgi:phosphopantetheinyl transferase
MENKIFTYLDSQIIIGRVDESVEMLLSRFKPTENEIIELKKIKSEQRKSEYIAVRLALKQLLGKKAEIEYDTDGKPWLTDRSRQISISHSRNFVAVMLHTHRNVGIDIECHSEKILKIYKRFLNQQEQFFFGSIYDKNQLLLLWSAKEVLYKIIGKTAVDFASQLEILPFEMETAGKIAARHLPTGTKYELYYQNTPDFVLVYGIA